jgi:hypothetical protein
LKIRLDENISFRVANALKAFMANKTGFEVSCVRDDHGPKTPDPSWLNKFADNDGDAIVSGDPHIIQHWPNLVAYLESGLIAIFPPPEFLKLSGYGRAAFLIRWWPTIVEKIKMSERGRAWRPPMSWTPDITKFRELSDPRFQTDGQRRGHGIQVPAKVVPFRPTG